VDKINPDVFVAVAAIAWADGKLDADEADAIVRAAVEAGLSLEDVARLEEEIVNKVDLDRALDRSSMTKEDRLFFYAVATWIAKLDGTVTLDESDALGALATKLEVPDRVRAKVEALVEEVARLPDGDRPVRYGLARLRELVGERLLAVPH
jgi:uncharacterized membrane protein YebE (DUF533 family)